MVEKSIFTIDLLFIFQLFDFRLENPFFIFLNIKGNFSGVKPVSSCHIKTD